jgi:hypothetical protein
MKQPVERRLAAILAADVAGYSRLMGVDEEGTHQRLKAHLSQLVDPKIKEHRGRIVKNTGDGMLAEFSSVVEAVRCAAEVQRGMDSGVRAHPARQRSHPSRRGRVLLTADTADCLSRLYRLAPMAAIGALCSRWLMTWRMGENAPKADLRQSLEDRPGSDGEVGRLIAEVHVNASRGVAERVLQNP